MTAPRRVVVAALVLWVAASLLTAHVAPAVRGAEYTLETAARYEVRPDEGVIEVEVDANFANTTPNPPGQFSVFSVVDLAVHDAATDVAALDEEGALDVSVAVRGVAGGDVTVATVKLRRGVRHGQEASFTLSYRLADSEDARLRVRPSLVVFPVWSFGTRGEVTVGLPGDYDVRADGEAMEQVDDPERVVLHADVADPGHWLSLLTATGPASYASSSTSVPLSGGTADLRVEAFADDAAWGERVLDLVERALPLLEEAIGIPYARVGPLVVRESVAFDASGFGEDGAAGTEMRVAYDQPDFTVLHQLAHLWVDSDLTVERWISEGLASHAAASVAAELKVSLPFDPAAEADAFAADAFALDAWPHDAAPGAERYGYAASWLFVDELAAAVGEGVMRETLERAGRGAGAYDADGANGSVGRAGQPLTSRSLLDQLEQLSGASLSDAFAATVFSATDAALLEQRAAARAEYASLQEVAGDWGAPEPVRAAMSVWGFDTAMRGMADARDWLAERDRLMVEMETAGLAAPDRLAEAYRAYGGGEEARTELAAERAVVQAYVATADAAEAPRTLVERVGLFGTTDPAQQLVAATGTFAEGDLAAAALAIGEARHSLEAAETNGLLRLLSLLALALLLFVVAWMLMRRRRPPGRAVARATLPGR